MRSNARMYGLTAAARAGWDGIFRHVARVSGLALSPIDHPAPAPLSDLWARPDLGCVVMCGWPFIEASPRPHLLAAPIPSVARFEGRAEYWSDLVVRADSPFRSLEDTFGSSIGWTVEDSHSGFNMPRHHLLRYRRDGNERLYATSIGGLVNPLGALTAVADGRVAVAPVDSFCHDLLRASGHPVTRNVRIVDRTEPSPMPVVIASADVSAADAGRLADALLSAHEEPGLAPHLEAALIARFVRPDESDYERGRTLDRAARAAGYAALA